MVVLVLAGNKLVLLGPGDEPREVQLAGSGWAPRQTEWVVACGFRFSLIFLAGLHGLLAVVDLQGQVYSMNVPDLGRVGHLHGMALPSVRPASLQEVHVYAWDNQTHAYRFTLDGYNTTELPFTPTAAVENRGHVYFYSNTSVCAFKPPTFPIWIPIHLSIDLARQGL